MFPHQKFVPQVRLRLTRAHDQLEALREEVRTFNHGGLNAVMGEIHDEGQRIVRYEISQRIILVPEHKWSVILGEIVHDIRAALDNLVCAMAYEHSTSDCERTEFPIFDDLVKYGDARKRKGRDPLTGIHPDAASIIDSLQPGNRADPHRDPLWILYSLSNADKHRLFHLAKWFVTSGRADIQAVRGCNVIEQETVLSRGPIKYGATLHYARLAITQPEYEVHVDQDFPLDIAFDETTPIVADEPVYETLCTILVYVAGVVEALERFAPPSILVVMTSDGFEKNPDYRS